MGGKYIAFIRKMLRWQPEEQLTVRELLKDEWLNGPDLEMQWKAVSVADQCLGVDRLLPQTVDMTDGDLRKYEDGLKELGIQETMFQEFARLPEFKGIPVR